jgi:hypothetical protein
LRPASCGSPRSSWSRRSGVSRTRARSPTPCRRGVPPARRSRLERRGPWRCCTCLRAHPWSRRAGTSCRTACVVRHPRPQPPKCFERGAWGPGVAAKEAATSRLTVRRDGVAVSSGWAFLLEAETPRNRGPRNR